MDLESQAIFRDMRFSRPWIDADVVTADVLRGLEIECAVIDDPSPEHFRWKVFHRFLSRQDPLSDACADDLYRLGGFEEDSRMGVAMMGAVLRHPQCPRALLDEALQSDNPQLQEQARRQQESRAGEGRA